MAKGKGSVKLDKKKETALAIIDILKGIYPDALCSLDYEDPFQLLVATRLAAQCTDARVNLVTPALFEKFPDAGAFAAATPEEVMPYIKSCGLFKTKARDIVSMAGMLLGEYNGEIPSTIEELIKLPGVGRKTANIIFGDVFGGNAVPADTHCIRLSNRMGLADSKDPLKVEMQLREILPPHESNNFCHRLVLFGRDRCNARSPKCDGCPLDTLCPRIGV